MCTLFLVRFLVPEDLSQNPSEEVKRGRKSSVDGSFPTFCRSSHCLHAPQKVCPLAFCALFFWNLQVVKNQEAVATSRGNGGFDGNSNLPATSTNGPNSMPWYVHDVFKFTGRFGSISKKCCFLPNHLLLFVSPLVLEVSIAGNGMDVPSVGFIQLAAILAWQLISFYKFFFVLRDLVGVLESNQIILPGHALPGPTEYWWVRPASKSWKFTKKLCTLHTNPNWSRSNGFFCGHDVNSSVSTFHDTHESLFLLFIQSPFFGLKARIYNMLRTARPHNISTTQYQLW